MYDTLFNSWIPDPYSNQNLVLLGLYGANFLCLDLKDEAAYLQKVSAFKRGLLRSNQSKLKTIVAIPAVTVNEDLKNIMLELSRYRFTSEED